MFLRDSNSRALLVNQKNGIHMFIYTLNESDAFSEQAAGL